VADLDDPLRSLTTDEWDAPAHSDHGRVRDVGAHLVGVEELVLRWLDPDETVPYLPDHIATRSVVAGLADTDQRDVARRWHEAARQVAAAAVGDRSRMVAFLDITISVDQLVVMLLG
jgi:hypothetical protein